MRYGFCLPHHRPLASPELILEAARRGEALGYDTIWLNDHLVPPDTPDQQLRRIFYEPLALAGFAAAVTSRVRLGFSVLVLPYRHPVVTAKQLATIDAMSGGRLIVGVGAGGLEAEFRALGVPVRRRGRLTDEYLRAMLELWTSDAPRFAGETIQFEAITFWPKPAQRPRPPILVGGHSPRALTRAVELGDGWHPSNRPLADLQAGIRDFRARCERAGRPASLPIVYRTNLRLLDASPGPRQPFSGTPPEIVDDLHAYAAAGLDELIVPDNTLGHGADKLERMDRLATEVFAKFR
jgi:probable F420-dependent oxidoreductase